MHKPSKTERKPCRNKRDFWESISSACEQRWHGHSEEVRGHDARGDEPLDRHQHSRHLRCDAGGAETHEHGRPHHYDGLVRWRAHDDAWISALLSDEGAVKMFTQGLSREVGDRGVTVNNIQPGPIDTDLNPAAGVPERQHGTQPLRYR
jgi:hypothetical protein